MQPTPSQTKQIEQWLEDFCITEYFDSLRFKTYQKGERIYSFQGLIYVLQGEIRVFSELMQQMHQKTSRLPNLGLFKPQKLSDIFLIFIYLVLEKAYLINKNKSIFLEFQTLFIGNLPHILYSYQLKFFKCFKHYTKHTPCFLLKNDQMIVELKSQSPKV